MAARFTLTMTISGGSNSVQDMLNHLDTCFSPNGMIEFMGSAVTPYLRLRAKNRFESEGDSASGKWRPLMPATVAIREAGIASGEWHGISGKSPINVRTRQMEEYITQGIGEVFIEGRQSASLFYPRREPPARSGLRQKIKRAQGGDSRTTRRPVLAVDSTDLGVITSRLAKFIEGKGYAS